MVHSLSNWLQIHHLLQTPAITTRLASAIALLASEDKDKRRNLYNNFLSVSAAYKSMLGETPVHVGAENPTQSLPSLLFFFFFFLWWILETRYPP